MNKAKLRREIASKLVKLFEESGIEYTCLASVMSVVRGQALLEAKELLKAGVNLSKGNYPMTWQSNMADMFSYDAAKIVHQKFLKSCGK